jgi:hypothetical protein
VADILTDFPVEGPRLLKLGISSFEVLEAVLQSFERLLRLLHFVLKDPLEV